MNKNIGFHPAADSFGMMDKGRFSELKQDIEQHGLLVPITLHEGLILDGRNRYRACQELGIEPTFVQYEGDPWLFTWSLNGVRRDLTADQRYLCWTYCEEHSNEWRQEQAKIAEEANRKRSEAAKKRNRKADGTLDKGPVMGQDAPLLAEDSHKGRLARARASKTSVDAVKRGELLKKRRPDLAEKVRMGELKPAEAHQQMKRDRREDLLAEARQRIAESLEAGRNDHCDIRHCSCKELFAGGIKPDAVITDPPYSKEYLPLYEELAVACKDVPLVAVMCGQTYLFDIGAMMCKHLQYRWTLAYMTPGAALRQWDRNIQCAWKPILLFGAKDRQVFDTVRSDLADKKYHDWGQSESGMADLIDKLTDPGQLICDPFLGGGTTAVVALRMARRFIGCDTDKDAVAMTIKRINDSDAASV